MAHQLVGRYVEHIDDSSPVPFVGKILAVTAWDAHGASHVLVRWDGATEDHTYDLAELRPAE